MSNFLSEYWLRTICETLHSKTQRNPTTTMHLLLPRCAQRNRLNNDHHHQSKIHANSCERDDLSSRNEIRKTTITSFHGRKRTPKHEQSHFLRLGPTPPLLFSSLLSYRSEESVRFIHVCSYAATSSRMPLPLCYSVLYNQHSDDEAKDQFQSYQRRSLPREASAREDSQFSIDVHQEKHRCRWLFHQLEPVAHRWRRRDMDWSYVFTMRIFFLSSNPNRKKKNVRLTTSKERESLTQRVSVFSVDVLSLRNSRNPGQVNDVCLLRLGLAIETAGYSSAHQLEKEIVYDDVQMPTRTIEFDRWFALHNWDTSTDSASNQ